PRALPKGKWHSALLRPRLCRPLIRRPARPRPTSPRGWRMTGCALPSRHWPPMFFNDANAEPDKADREAFMKKTIPLAAIGLAAALGGTWFLTQADRPSGTTMSLPGAASAQDSAAVEIDTSTITEMVQGSADAPVEVIEYASFTCPHCATFHN